MVVVGSVAVAVHVVAPAREAWLLDTDISGQIHGGCWT